MAETIANAVLGALGIFLGAGLLFALPFALFGVARVDPSAAHATLGFRLLIVPGLAVFWPLFLSRWLRGMREPPVECTAHRACARANDPGASRGGTS